MKKNVICPACGPIEEYEKFGEELCCDCKFLFIREYNNDKHRLINFILKSQLALWKKRK